MRARVLVAVVVAVLACMLVAGVVRWRSAARVEVPVADAAPDLRAAVPAGAAEKQWVLMKVVTPTWNKELRRSDEFAWNDSRVRAWVEKNATVVTVDVATDAETQRALALENAPALLAFKGYKEFDRIGLHQSPRGLMEWFAGLERGERSAEKVVGPTPVLPDAALENAMLRRWGEARGLVQAGEYAKATEAYVWLWDRISLVMYCRSIAFQRDITELVKTSAEARAAFVGLRDAALERMRAEKVPPLDVLEFVQLNRVMEDEESTMAWYEEARVERRRMPLIRIAANEILSVLRREKRWEEACDVIGDPMFQIEQDRQLEDAMALSANSDTRVPKIVEFVTSERCRRVAVIYGALLGAGREAEARRFGDKARAEFRDPLMTYVMVVTAWGVGESRHEHLQWLQTDSPENFGKLFYRVVERAVLKRLRDMTWY